MKEPKKQSWSSPELTVHGSIEQLTAKNNGSFDLENTPTDQTSQVR
jgi:hypothetical protein